MSDREAEFREFVAARMESLRGLAYLTCGDWQVAEDAVLGALAKLYVRWRRVDNPDAYARTAVVRSAIDETRRPWWRREQSHSHAALPDRVAPDETHGVDERLRLRAALGRLPVKQRAVVGWLHHRGAARLSAGPGPVGADRGAACHDPFPARGRRHPADLRRRPRPGAGPAERVRRPTPDRGGHPRSPGSSPAIPRPASSAPTAAGATAGFPATSTWWRPSAGASARTT